MNYIENVLIKIIEILGDKVWWVLGGRTGLYIRGVDVELDNEIDICTTKDGVTEIEKLLNEYCIESTKYGDSPNFTAYMAKFEIDGVIIEVMGDPKKKFSDGSWIGLPIENIVNIQYKDKSLNVFTLESEYKYYESTSVEKPKRKLIAEKIKEKLFN